MDTSTGTIDSDRTPATTRPADGTVDGEGPGRRFPWLRRLGGVLLVLAATVGLAAPAQAYIPPGPQTYAGPPATFTVSMSCWSGQIQLTPMAAVQSGYTNGQYVTYRYALWSNRGHRGATSGWSSPELQPYSTVSMGSTYLYARTPLATANIPATRGTYWEVAVQVGWYAPGYGYIYSPWRSVDGHQSGFISPYPYSGSKPCNT